MSVINLKLLKQNALYLRSLLCGRKLYAVVKADAYGHGGARVALALEDVADGFCTAIIDEGVQLRLAGVTKPVLVFTPPLDGDDAARAALYNLTVTVNSVATAKLAYGLPCHIKVNTGMNRMGCGVEELGDILSVLPADCVCGVYSHLYNPCDRASALEQLEIFNRAEAIVKKIAPQAEAHIAASGGVLSGKEFLKDGARCGLLLYGYAPAGFEAEVKPVLKVYARRMQITPFIGGGAGYAPAQKRYKQLSCYRAGYADGFFRTVPLGENFLCMDSFLKDGGGEYELIFGNADEYAERCGTISYETLCSVTRRSLRIYEE